MSNESKAIPNESEAIPDESEAIPDDSKAILRKNRSDLTLLLAGKKPYATFDTAVFGTACGCCCQAKSRTLLPIQQP
jgi:hypothetical protein